MAQLLQGDDLNTKHKNLLNMQAAEFLSIVNKEGWIYDSNEGDLEHVGSQPLNPGIHGLALARLAHVEVGR